MVKFWLILNYSWLLLLAEQLAFFVCLFSVLGFFFPFMVPSDGIYLHYSQLVIWVSSVTSGFPLRVASTTLSRLYYQCRNSAKLRHCCLSRGLIYVWVTAQLNYCYIWFADLPDWLVYVTLWFGQNSVAKGQTAKCFKQSAHCTCPRNCVLISIQKWNLFYRA